MPTLPAAFADQSLGRMIRMDVSLDNWATITYRYADTAGYIDTGNAYVASIAKVGRLSRGFGADRIAASSSMDVLFDNTDNGMDWMLSQVNWANVSKARFRVYVVVLSSFADTIPPEWQLGEFVIGDYPRRNNKQVQVQLVDDVLGALAQSVTLPTPRLWAAAASSTVANCPYYGQGELIPFNEKFATMDTPIQLAFGDDWVTGICPGAMTTADTTYWADSISGEFVQNYVAVPVYCTVDSSALPGSSVSWDLNLVSRITKRAFNVPQTIVDSGTFGSGNTLAVWTPVKSAAVIVDGRTFYIVYAKISLQYLAAYYRQSFISPSGLGGPSWGFVGNDLQGDTPLGPQTNNTDPALASGSGSSTPAFGWETRIRMIRGSWLLANCDVYVRFDGASSVRNNTSLRQHGANVIYDIVASYAKGLTVSNLDTASIDRTIKVAPNSSASGSISRASTVANDALGYTPDSLRDIVTKIAQSCDFDVFTTWDGKIATSGDFIDYDTYTGLSSYTQVTDLEATEIEDFFPSQGERGAPFNRLYLTPGKTNPAEEAGAGSQGPYDHVPLITSFGRIIARTLEQGWRSYEGQQKNPFYFRNIDVRIRPRVRFRVPAALGFQLELGSFFRFTWTRGGGGAVYSDTIFQTERLEYNPDDESVEVEAMWKDDVLLSNYLLDDETYLTRVASSGGRTVTVTDGSDDVVFSSGSLISDGVAIGDILILKDATQAANVFTRFRALRIALISGATDASLVTSDDALGNDFDAPSGVAVATWIIVRANPTYPTDLTNYPDGNAMYGRTSNDADQYSNSTDAAQIQNG